VVVRVLVPVAAVVRYLDPRVVVFVVARPTQNVPPACPALLLIPNRRRSGRRSRQLGKPLPMFLCRAGTRHLPRPGSLQRIQPKLVDDLDNITGKLRHMDDQMGGGSLIDVVRAQIGYVARLRREGRYSDSTGRRLHGTLGELLRLGGWVSYDDGDQAQAQRFWIAALHSAHTAGDRCPFTGGLAFSQGQSVAKRLKRARGPASLQVRGTCEWTRRQRARRERTWARRTLSGSSPVSSASSRTEASMSELSAGSTWPPGCIVIPYAQ
jgi:hypothetical protein